MKNLELAKYLADSASELITLEMSSGGVNADRLNEAQELLNLSTRILSRSDVVVNEETIQEAA